MPEPAADDLDRTAVKPAHQPPPTTAAAIGPVGRVPGYEVGAELARGGMGVVYAARDTVLDRPVALKTLLPGTPGGEPGGRFTVEARITARLPHPNIPPVHALGTLPDGRPFLAMKLIRGRTLRDLLKDRPDPAHDLPRFVHVFEQVCQAVGFAHAEGVVHRDLKPSNVMVGAFGEVQVMDWGLAKAGVRGQETGVREDEARAVPEPTGFEIDDSQYERTRTGEGMGTPEYMPPEQAKGEWDKVGARADVFALGGVLGSILTGKAPYSGTSSHEALRKAAAAELGETVDRLGRCGADPELVALATRCLAADPAARPADGGGVARLVAEYRAGVADRLRAAELRRAGAEARAAEQRRKRRWQGAAITAAGLLGVGAVAAAWWQEKQDADRRAEDLSVAAGKKAAALLRQLEDERRAADERERVGRNAAAMADLVGRCEAALRQAAPADAARAAGLLEEIDSRLKEGGGEAVADRVARCRADAAALREVDRADEFRWTPSGGRFPDPADIARRWRGVLAGFGAEPGAVPAADAARRVADSLVRDRLLASLDGWLLYDPDPAARAAVRAVLAAADPDPYRDAVRDAAAAPDRDRERDRMAALLARPEALAVPPWFAAALGHVGAAPADRRREILGVALGRRPADLALLMGLARTYPLGRREGADERARWCQAAVAVAPGNVAAVLGLGNALRNKGDRAGALAAYRTAVGLAPADPLVRANLGVAQLETGDRAGAEATYREVLRLDPDYVGANTNLGVMLMENGDPAGAVPYLRAAARLAPKDPPAHSNLGAALFQTGDLDGAVGSFGAAVRLAPGDAGYRAELDLAVRRRAERDGRVAPPPREAKRP